MNRTNPKVDGYLKRAKTWQEETKKMRKILLDCQLTEELKWGKPCYTFENKIIAVIQGFKAYFALMFFKGALLKDPHGLLVAPGKNSQSGRQLRFTTVREITEQTPILRAYISEAIAVEKAGLKVIRKKTTDYAVPKEFQKKLDEIPALKKAFDALTPGRQRGYLLHFSAAKQSQTRETRVAKWTRHILAGKGLNDE
jgi:uncharacterized protein YdeI (YjbR/CyaY-like superfamily)